MKKILIKSKKINRNTLDEIYDLIPLYKYEDLYKYGDIEKLKRYIDRNSEYLTGDVKLKCNSVKNKSKMLNIDILEIYLLVIYARQYYDYDKINKEELNSIVETSYNEAYEEVKKKRPRRSQFKTLLDDWLYLYIPSLMMSYNDYMIARAINDSQDTRKAIVLKLQQNDNETLKKTLNKQFNYYINYNPKTKIMGIGGYSGAVDKTVSYLVNKAVLQGYTDAGVEQVRYIAVIDKKTTGTCRSLDLQVFWVNKENEFMRDDGYGKLRTYKVHGLESGINLPPVVPPIHPCRSMIEYVR